MNEYGPYRFELSYKIAACRRGIDLDPSEKVTRIGRNVAHLQD